VGPIGVFRVVILTCVLAFSALCAGQASADHHISADPEQRLYRASPFAHGYIHGYEVGFGMGNEDVQIGRGAQEVRKSAEYKSASEGYAAAFGSRESFRAGFREGLAIGYRDGFAGGEFRALGELRRLATGVEGEAAVDRLYDGGFFAGYRAARQEAADQCQQAPAGRERFCSGFLDGYELGESDTGVGTTARERSAAAPVLLPRPGGRSAPRR
jgi:hypothetical protein